MAAIIDLWLPLDKISELKRVLEKKGQSGVALIVTINDEENKFGQNVSVHVKQTEEQRKEKKPRYYVANGKVVWSNGEPPAVAGYKQKSKPSVTSDDENDDDMPF